MQPKIHILLAVFYATSSVSIAMMQTASAAGASAIAPESTSTSLLGLVTLVNGILSVGVVLGALGLAYGYGRLNNRVEVAEGVTEELQETVRQVQLTLQRLVAIEDLRIQKILKE